MRRTRLFILLIAVSAAFLSAQTDPPGRVGGLNYINGPVSFQPAGVTDWVDADVTRPPSSAARSALSPGRAATRPRSEAAT